MGEDRNWILLSNTADKMLARNKLFYDLGAELGLDFSIKSAFVEFYINGSCQGMYQLCERCEEGINRVPVGPGGWVVQMDDNWNDGVWFTDAWGRRFEIIDPDITMSATAEIGEIKNYINTFEEALYSPNSCDRSGRHFTEYADLDSLVNYYILHEFAKNLDTTYKSTYMYRFDDGPMYMGPAWDFDLSGGNAAQFNCNSPSGWFVSAEWARSAWYDQMVKDPIFCARLAERYEEVHPILEAAFRDTPEKTSSLTRLANVILSCDNYSKWDVTGNYTGQGWIVSPLSGYGAEIEYLRDFLQKRLAWMDANIASLTGGAKRNTGGESHDFSGSGTKDAPYVIKDAEDFSVFTNALRSGTSFDGVYFAQQNDIDMTAVITYRALDSKQTFAGVYDGAGHAITVNADGNDAAVFPYVTGVVANLTVCGTVRGASYSGGLARSVRGGGSVVNCLVKTDIYTDYSAGGIAVSNDYYGSHIVNCVYDGAIISNANERGGIIATVRDGGGVINSFYTSKNSYTTQVSGAAALETTASAVSELNGNLSQSESYAKGVPLCEWFDFGGGLALLPRNVEITDRQLPQEAAPRSLIAEFSLAGGAAREDVDGIYGSKSLGYSSDGRSNMFYSVTGSDYRKIEWSDASYGRADGNYPAVCAVMCAGDKNNWGDATKNPPFFEFRFSTLGYENVTFSARVGASNNGPRSYALLYSTDGKNFTDSGARYTLDENKYLETAFKDVPLVGADDQKRVYVRIVAASNETVSGALFAENPKSGEAAIGAVKVFAAAKEGYISHTQSGFAVKNISSERLFAIAVIALRGGLSFVKTQKIDLAPGESIAVAAEGDLRILLCDAKTMKIIEER